MLRQRSLSALGIIAVTVTGVLAGGWILALLLAIIGLGALRELGRALEPHGATPYRWLAAVLLLASMLVAWRVSSAPPTLAAVSLTLAAPFVAGFWQRDMALALRRAVATTMGTLSLALPLSAALALRNITQGDPAPWVRTSASWLGSAATAPGMAWLGWAIAVTWLTDTGAYFGGSLLGGPKLAPHLSPGKTWAGALSGTLCGAITGWAIVWLTHLPLTGPSAVILSAGLSIIGQLGDLAESLLKRALGIKDMGNTIPGHGGILDRIDALLFTFPTALALAWWVSGR